jgi:hypothetical protein
MENALSKQNTKQSIRRKRAVAEGFRSAFEYNVATQLKEAKIAFEYEPRDKKMQYHITLSGTCVECGCEKIIQRHEYLPDFLLKNNVILETKGIWSAEDRRKMLAVIRENSDLKIVMMFQAPFKKLSKKVTYADYCDKNGIVWTHEKENWIQKIKQLTK